MWGIGTVLGPVVGGSFTDSSATWRWAFYINLPIGALVAPFIIFLIPSFDAQKGTPLLQRLKQPDWVGIVLFSGAIASLILALMFGGNEFAWNSGQVIGCFVSFGESHMAISNSRCFDGCVCFQSISLYAWANQTETRFPSGNVIHEDDCFAFY
jgi:MFS family permease